MFLRQGSNRGNTRMQSTRPPGGVCDHPAAERADDLHWCRRASFSGQSGIGGQDEGPQVGGQRRRAGSLTGYRVRRVRTAVPLGSFDGLRHHGGDRRRGRHHLVHPEEEEGDAGAAAAGCSVAVPSKRRTSVGMCAILRFNIRFGHFFRPASNLEFVFHPRSFAFLLHSRV